MAQVQIADVVRQLDVFQDADFLGDRAGAHVLGAPIDILGYGTLGDRLRLGW